MAKEEQRSSTTFIVTIKSRDQKIFSHYLMLIAAETFLNVRNNL